MNSIASSEPGLPSGPGQPVSPDLHARPGIHWPSAAQFALSLIAAFLSFSSAVGLLGLGFAQLMNPAGTTQENLTIFVGAASALLTGILLLPSAWYSFLRLIGRPVLGPTWLGWFSDNPLPLILALILLLISLLLGNFVSNDPRIAWLLLPPLQLLAIGLPVYIFSSIGRWKISTGFPQRSWGIFSAGLVLGPVFILVLEVLAGAGLIALGLIYVSMRPDLQQELTRLAEQIRLVGNSPDEIFKIMAPFLLNPWVILVLFAFLSGIVPMIEEALKPIGVYFVAGSHLTAFQGFAAGLLSGTGYALFENLALSNSGGDWTVTVIGRIGTGLLHITTAGLVGWALITAINERRYLRLVAIYLVSVFIHGFWNALALLSAVSDLDLAGYGNLGGSVNHLTQVAGGAALALLMMIAIIFLVLLGMNRMMRRLAHPEVT